MKLKRALASISIAVSINANSSELDLNLTTKQGQADHETVIEQEIADAYYSGLVDEFGSDSVLTPIEQVLLQRKIDAIEKRIVEQEKLRPHIENLYQENAIDALDQYVRDEYGFSAEQWKALRIKEMEIAKAKNEPIANVKINIREETLDNGSVTPVDISVVKGYATAIVFVDAAGNPWPILGDITGDGNAYSSKKSLDHVAVIDNINEFKESNALVNLEGMDIPVVLRLKSNRTVSDSRVIVHLPELGPGSQSELTLLSTKRDVGSDMNELLNTGRVSGAREFAFREMPGSIYLKNEWMYLRTKKDLVLPSPMEISASPTGYNVYKIPASNTFLFRDDAGVRLTATLGEARDIEISHITKLYSK